VQDAERQLKNVDAMLAAAAEALSAFADFLEQEIAPAANGEFACGRERFDHLLQYRHFLELDADRLHQFGAELFEHTQRELRDVCLELTGTDDVAALTRKIQADHPAADELLDSYRKQMQAAKEFVARHDLVSLPESEHLEVVATPEFLCHQIPFAAYMEPAANDARQQGYYYVTPAPSDEMLREHNHAGLMHTCVHEAWPGHHLQFVTANLRSRSSSYARLLNPSATLYEGWALYCEQLMLEEGFLGRPEQRFILLKDRLWRALRILLDVELHTRGLGVEAAARRMQEHLGFPYAQALADVTWYTRAPTVPMGYATGWALIGAVRDQLRLREGPAFSLRTFHDRLLSAGSVALPLVVQRAFGDDTWRRASGMVYGNSH
jgi:uncharacterized protein (DUF885 family)